MPALASPSFVALLPRLALGLLLWMLTVSASADEKAQTRTDAFGDPLPAGAIARLGTVRLRHADSILAIAFTPDGKQLVSAGEDAVRVWDAATGRPLRSFAPGTPQGTVCHHRDLQAASLSPDGRLIAISKYGYVRRVEVWDVTTGKLVHRLGKDCVFSRLCFSPDGKRLAALADHLIGGGQTIDLWDVATGEHMSGWRVSGGSVRSLTFSADSKALLVGGSEKALSFRDVSTGKEVRRLRDLPGDVDDLVLSPQGDRAAYIEWAERKVGDRSFRREGRRAFLVDLRTGKELRRWAVPESEGFLRSLAYSPDGNKVAACSCDGPLRLWDTKSGKEIKPLSDGLSIASAVAFSPNGRTLAAVCEESVVRLIDPTTGKNRVPATAHLGSVLLVTATRDGHTSFTAGADGIIYCWDTRNGRERRRLLGHPHGVSGLALSPDERALFSTGSEGTLRIWDLASGKERRQVRPSHFLGPFTLSPDGATLAACDFTRLLLFDPVRGKGRSEREMKNIAAIAFAPDSSSVTVLTRDGAISRVETRTNHVLSQWNVSDAVESAMFRERVGALSSDGRLAAFAESYQILRVLDVEAKQEIRRLTRPPGLVSTIAFAPDSRTLAWAEGYGVIHWLEVASGRERRTLSGHVGRVMRMVFTADGKRLLSASEDGTVLVWDLLGPGATTLSTEQRDACWADLADKDAARAYRAMRRLIAAPEDAFLCLRFRLKPVEGMDEKAIERLVVDLDSDHFAVREKATKELRKLGELAEPACRKALESRPTLEMSRRLRALLDEVSQHQWHLTPEIMRQVRAVEVLERIGTPEARELLEALSRGAAGARLSYEARTAAHRLAHCSGEQGPSTPR